MPTFWTMSWVFDDHGLMVDFLGQMKKLKSDENSFASRIALRLSNFSQLFFDCIKKTSLAWNIAEVLLWELNAVVSFLRADGEKAFAPVRIFIFVMVTKYSLKWYEDNYKGDCNQRENEEKLFQKYLYCYFVMSSWLFSANSWATLWNWAQCFHQSISVSYTHLTLPTKA